MKQKMTESKGETDSFTLIVGDFNPTFNTRTTIQKIDKEIENLNNTINQLHQTET